MMTRVWETIKENIKTSAKVNRTNINNVFMKNVFGC